MKGQMMEQSEKKYITLVEYFELEESAEYKSEYYHGELFAMTGAVHEHNVIAMNAGSHLHSALRDSDCFVYGSDMKIQVDEGLHYTYPDISIVCGEVDFAAGRKDIAANPVVIIEILSKGTRDYDRGSKFMAYRGVRSLKDYILIDQYSCHMEYFHKIETGQWVLDEFKEMEDTPVIKSIGVELPLTEVYHRIKFSDAQ